MKKNIFQTELVDCMKKYAANKAIEYGDRVLTYGQLAEKSDYIKNYLQEKGLKKGTFVGILALDRIEYISCIIGILKAGGAFVPMDPANPDSRLLRMIEVLKLDIIFIDENYRQFSLSEPVKERDIQFIHLEHLKMQETAAPLPTAPDSAYTPEDKLYVYFTSGTTYLPEAVVGKSKSLLNYIHWEIQAFQFDENLRISQFATTSDAFLKEIFVTFLSGGTLCIPPDLKQILYPEALVDWLEKSRINAVHCVPHVFRILSSGKLTPANLPVLNYLVLSGEEIRPPDLKNWYDKIGERVQLVNLYGTTETTILNTCYLIKKPDVHRERIPVGQPIKGNRVIILDEKMNICPNGIPGEMYIRTPYRTFGYHNNDELNRKKFIQNPFNHDPDDLLFKTGDLGRVLPDGNLEYLGRMDRQVKIRGHRIELAEIESILTRHPFIQEAVVLKKELANKSEVLLAYITPKKETPAENQWSTDEIKDYLTSKLPEYMVPARIVKLEELPRKPNRKIDHHRLPDVFKQEEDSYEAPRDDIETKLHRYWTDILKRDKIGTRNNFFENGGSSLNVMSLLHKIHQELDIRLSLGEIFNNPTIEKQAEIIRQAQTKEQENKFIPIAAAEKREYYPLSPAQQRLYVLNRLDPASTGYNMPLVLLSESKMEKQAIQRIFEKLLQRHESLRTSFGLVKGQPMQFIRETAAFAVDRYESSQAEAPRLVRDFVRPFDPGKAPLLRVGLIKLNGTGPGPAPARQQHIFIVDIHHIISDGTSQQMLIRDFMTLYHGGQLAPLRLQYKDYTRWQHSRSGQENTMAHEAYWQKQFAGEIPTLEMPTDFPRPPVKDYIGQIIAIDLGGPLSQRLTGMAAQTGVTLYMLLLAALNVLLSRYTRQEDITVGSPVPGRPRQDLQNIIGMFVNMLAMRNRPTGSKTFAEFLAEVKKNALEAYENQDYPFDRLVTRLGLQRTRERNPLFDIVLQMAMKDNGETGPDTPGARDHPMEIKPYEVTQVPCMFDLHILVMEAGPGIILQFTYATALFKKSKIEKMAKNYVEILEQAIENRDMQLKDLVITQTLVKIKSTHQQAEASDFAF